jgi:hypothetical protein
MKESPDGRQALPRCWLLLYLSIDNSRSGPVADLYFGTAVQLCGRLLRSLVNGEVCSPSSAKQKTENSHHPI